MKKINHMQNTENAITDTAVRDPILPSTTAGHGGIALEILELSPDEIRPMKDQPRRWFDTHKINELAESIAEVGQAQPGKVRPIVPPENGKNWELVSGERRCRACSIAGKLFRAEVDRTPMSPIQQFEKALTCNSDQEQLMPTEAALAIQRLKAANRTDKQIALIMSQAVGWVSRHYKLLSLEPKVFALLGPDVPEERRLSVAIAIELISAPADYQIDLADEITVRGLSALQARDLIKRTLRAGGLRKPSMEPAREFKAFARFTQRTLDQLQNYLETPAPVLRAMFSAGLQERMEAFEMLEEITKGMPELAEDVQKILKLPPAEHIAARVQAIKELQSLTAGFSKIHEMVQKVMRDRAGVP